LLTVRAQLFYGTCDGGYSGMGVLFSYNVATASYKKVFEFDYYKGSFLTAALPRQRTEIYMV
jgi:hypothetical protein